MATLQTVIGVYIVTGEGLKDFYERVPVSTKSTAKEVVGRLVKKLFGDKNPDLYALYEAEYVKGKTDGIYVAKEDNVAKSDDDLMFLKGEQITLTKKISDDVWMGECEGISGKFPANKVEPLSSGDGKIDGETQRKFLRVLRDSEIPLFVQYNWKYQNASSNLNFILKERDVEVREGAGKEFYSGFSKAKLQGLLDDLDAQEKHALAQIENKYKSQKQAYQRALDEAKKKIIVQTPPCLSQPPPSFDRFPK
eukprot:NODE_1367_length_889_cov_79.489501_g1321_i0.p1 GENE.NODE_1367_length_889_cov_79.489501_g1321_i0~~NODE_1367_length_889_cov_79.489501_g1321_i0.p1  ORF type:complete len:251 (-),score=48.83 NODE_1367_length_889_cov_79.489501_g1321_i0:61-813(-)